MIRAVIGADDAVISWAAQILPQCPRDRASAIGIADDDKLVAACVYSDFRRNMRGQAVDLRMTMVSANPGWWTRGMVVVLFRYPFLQLECVRVTALIGKHNKKSRRLAEKAGFRIEGCHSRAWDGTQDAISYGMLRSQCKWIGNGQIIERRTGAA